MLTGNRTYTLLLLGWLRSSYEKDPETGYDYYGARYYTDRLSVWLSVDPLTDKYPSLSGYNYCADNPVRFIDPNGKEIGDPLKNMQVRRNAVWCTFGMVRKKSDGTPKAHQGIDYKAPIGTDILAVGDGQVVSVSQSEFYGLGVTMKFSLEDGTVAWAYYAHLSEISVGDINYKENDLPQNSYLTLDKPIDVKEGDVLGKTGDSGNSKGQGKTDQHLHFEYRTKEGRLGKGLANRDDPNKIVDTKFEKDPNKPGYVRKVQKTNE